MKEKKITKGRRNRARTDALKFTNERERKQELG